MNYVSSSTACKTLQITAMTLKRWKDNGHIKTKQLSSRKILYDIDSVLKNDKIDDDRLNVIYARVSTTKQKNDLNNQIELIKNYMINSGIKPDKVYSEIASGINDNRKELNSLLSDIMNKKIKSVYITFKDRLTRFGFNYFQEIMKINDVNLVVIDEIEETNKDLQTELTEDLIAIIDHYSTKLYSTRKQKLKAIKNILSEDK